MFSLALIEDNPEIRSVLTVYLGELQGYDLVLTAGSYEDFEQNWKKKHLDIVICDIGLPGKSGIDLAWKIKEISPATQILMFTVFDDHDNVFRALCAGASGYLLKNTPLSKLKFALDDLMEGGAAMSPTIARQVLDFFNAPRPTTVQPERLTPRELEIASLIREGLPNQQIADRLFVSVNAVKYHIKNIYLKLQINSREELIRKYTFSLR
ncbi:response regulator transcription factor [Spirosoma sp. BT702]|uniref:Response regulator transcription factor n=1 Tax=Spirosoma profusum TaxID=2771354 RepID=A0A927AUV9_9BACT|nr:response regulator transcription factor [Spirosoma profusum]MBD2704848.1 response regulator transcription factor [Spirosoma profusum]